jgi:hypothetical protein
VDVDAHGHCVGDAGLRDPAGRQGDHLGAGVGALHGEPAAGELDRGMARATAHLEYPGAGGAGSGRRSSSIRLRSLSIDETFEVLLGVNITPARRILAEVGVGLTLLICAGLGGLRMHAPSCDHSS